MPAQHSRRCLGLLVLALGAVFGCASDRERTVSASPLPARLKNAATEPNGTTTLTALPKIDEAPSPVSLNAIHRASYLQDAESPPIASSRAGGRDPEVAVELVPAPLGPPAPEKLRTERYPIDLPSALQLAVGQNPQIGFARERIAAASARFDRAAVQWLPDLVIDPTWTRHDGQIQDTRGDVIQVSRSALFASGGARMHVSTSEAYFAPLAARQVVAGRMAGSLATTNETLRDVSLAYWELVRARGKQAVVREAARNTEHLDDLAQSYLRAENLKPADADRIRTQTLARQQELELVEQDVRVASSRLARLLRLDPFVQLIPSEKQPVAVDYGCDSLSKVDLATTALSNRPELAEHRAFVGAAVERLREARLGPVLPSLVVDVSAGGFGGGANGFFGDFDGRSDVGAAAIWEFENLGFGDRALIRERASAVRQAELSVVATMDRVVAEAAEAVAAVEARRNQLDLARRAVTSAANSHERNLRLFSDAGVELILPLEVLQSVDSLRQAQLDFLDAVIEHNKAQIQLHWSVGFPVESVVQN